MQTGVDLSHVGACADAAPRDGYRLQHTPLWAQSAWVTPPRVHPRSFSSAARAGFTLGGSKCVDAIGQHSRRRVGGSSALARRVCERAPVALSSKEFDIVVMLAEHPGWVVSADQLSREAEESGCSPEPMSALVCRLRQRLAEAGASEVVETVRGLRYWLRSPNSLPLLRVLGDEGGSAAANQRYSVLPARSASSTTSASVSMATTC